MRFSEYVVGSGAQGTGQEGEVRVWGESDVLVVSAPVPGVLRVRLAPEARAGSLSFPRLGAKRSFAVRPDLAAPLTLSVQEADTTLTVVGGGLSLTLDRLSGAWQVGTGSGSSARVLVSALGWSGEAPAARAATTCSLTASAPPPSCSPPTVACRPR